MPNPAVAKNHFLYAYQRTDDLLFGDAELYFMAMSDEAFDAHPIVLACDVYHDVYFLTLNGQRPAS